MSSKFSAYKLRKWSIQCRWRDRCCQICGSKERLEAHHINDKSYHPEQAYRLSNGVTLCGGNKKTGKACHRAFHTIFMGSYRKKCTKADFDKFKKLMLFMGCGEQQLVMGKKKQDALSLLVKDMGSILQIK